MPLHVLVALRGSVATMPPAKEVAHAQTHRHSLAELVSLSGPNQCCFQQIVGLGSYGSVMKFIAVGVTAPAPTTGTLLVAGQ